MAERRVVIVGAGPGGLTAAMILAHRGYKVSVYERESGVGGRNRAIEKDGYLFDIGPTFLMMDFVLREVFEAAGKRAEDYMELKPLDPMYTLSFPEFDVNPTADDAKMTAEIEKLFPGDGVGLARFMKREKVRYEKMYPCLQKDYSTLGSMVSAPLLRALPHLSLAKTLYGNLASYFAADKCRISFTFQAKYLGMSPWDCPAAFTIIPYIEHKFGIYHVTGGLSRISDAMAEVARENGADIHLSTPVERILVKDRCAQGVRLAGGEEVRADAVVVNADFGYAATKLFEPGVLHKWTPARLARRPFSCSTFMLYLGLDKLYDEPHHRILFANDYKANIFDIARRKRLSDDMSIYIRNASITDPTLAPAGHSALYVLVPVANTSAAIDWTPELVQQYREKVLDRMCERTSMKDLRSHIRTEVVIDPRQWEHERNLYRGATFNLAHTLGQMLYFRPRNRFEEVANCYLVGGGTHPGSGLPTIYESARISSNLLCSDIRLGEVGSEVAALSPA